MASPPREASQVVHPSMGDLQFALTARGVPATVRLIHRQQFEDVEESDFERLKAAQRYVFATVRLPRS